MIDLLDFFFQNKEKKYLLRTLLVNMDSRVKAASCVRYEARRPVLKTCKTNKQLTKYTIACLNIILLEAYDSFFHPLAAQSVLQLREVSYDNNK
jgi:hypothetical protein